MIDRIDPAPDGLRPPAASEFRLYRMALLAALLGIAAGISSTWFYSAGLFIKPLQDSFGWSRTAITVAGLTGSIATALAAPLTGALADRFGPRGVCTVSLLAVAAYFHLLSRIGPSVLTFILLGTAMAVLTAGSTPVTFTRIVAARFARHRGLALGIALSGAGITGTILPRLLVPHIAEHGWRSGYQALAITVLAATPVFWWLATRDAAQPRPAGSARSAGMLVEGEGATMGFALRSRTFWIVTATFLLAALAIGGFIAHLVPLLSDHGIAPVTAGGIAALVGLFVIVGRIATGVAIDRLPVRVVASSVLLIAAAGCMLLFVGGTALAPVAAACVGLALGTEMDLVGFLAARHFGLRNYGSLYGLLFSVFVIGMAASPVLYALVHDAHGGYGPALVGAAVLLLAAAAFASRIPELPAWPARPRP